jgi:formate dehydrogenase major subunit
MLTNPVLDPFGKIPEFKYCAVRVTAGGTTPERMSFGGGQLLADVVPARSRAPRA